LLWLPANLAALATAKRGTRTFAGIALVLVSVATFAAGTHWIISMRRAKAENRRIVQLSSEAAAAKDNFGRYDEIIQSYCSASPRSIYPQRGYYRVVAALVRNPASPPELLQKVSDGLQDGHEFLAEIAEHPNCPEQAIRRFRQIPKLVVHLARNPNASPELIDWLAQLEDANVRGYLAANPRTSSSVLTRLSNDKDLWVRSSVTNRMERDRIARSAVIPVN
jgi:hypothetical protein